MAQKKMRNAQPRRPAPPPEHTRVLHPEESRAMQEALREQPRRRPPKKTVAPWEEERLRGAKIYRLTGYTTVEKVQRKFRSEEKQKNLRSVITTLILVMAVLILAASFLAQLDREEVQRIRGNQPNDPVHVIEEEIAREKAAAEEGE